MQDLIKETWLFPVIQSIHIVGLTILVGTIALVDFRLLGLRINGIATPKLARQLAPWTSAGLITAFITGPLLFWSDLGRYVSNPAFLIKMLCLSVALATHVQIQRKITAVEAQKQKWMAVFSLAAWSCVVLAGRAIADFDIRAL